MSDSLPVLSGSLALGRYRVVKELARGGMGMVYLGRIEGAAGFAKPVVIKRVLSHMDEAEGSRGQFIREARLLSELHHPNIVGVMDFGQEGDSYLMVLEYVHGYHVGNWLKYVRQARGQLEWELAVYVVTRVLSALHYAHTRLGSDGKMRPIIHRDVSPGNVLIDLQGNVRLLDFGIARVSDDGDEFKTQEGIVKGKLPYIAPEMYQSTEASVLSDVYAAGVMLYQMLSGKNPFSGKDMSTIVTRVLQHTPPPISSLRDDVPAGLDVVLARAIAKDPQERFGTAQAFAYALGALLESPEPEVVESLRTAVVLDFSGDMPKVLGIPSLAELDHAWRASSPFPHHEESLERSSLPPDEDATAIVAVQLGEARVGGKVSRDSGFGEQAGKFTPAGRRLIPSGPALADQSSTAPVGANTRTIVLGMVGAGLLAGGLTAGVLLLGKNETPPTGGQRFLLVERPGVAQTASGVPLEEALPVDSGAPVAPSATAIERRQVSSPAAAPAPARSPSVASPDSAEPAALSDSQKLTAAFSKRQTSVQACFSRTTGQLEGAPQVSVHFKLDAEGQIQAASLSPAALGATALGQCLLDVARGTTFPSLGKPVGFSIPITARVMTK